MTKRFVLLDRDGTINVERHYLSDPAQLELIDGAAAGIAALNAAGVGVVVVTNQSAVGRGYLDLEGLGVIHARLEDLLRAEGARLDGVFFCPHLPQDDCRCRKPHPGMIEQAVERFGFDPRQAFVVGDKEIDIELGHGVGAMGILVRTGYGAECEAVTQADLVVDDLLAAARHILATISGNFQLDATRPM